MSTRPGSARPGSARVGARPQQPSAEKGNRVQVAIRVRPINRSDGADAKVAVRQDEMDRGSVLVDDGRRGRTFSFDNVFCGGQQEVFESIGKPMLDEAYKGFNVCLFAYGQTGSGKTYSVQGSMDSEEKLGLIPRFVREMFAQAQQMVEDDPQLTIKFTMSYLEIYMEKIRDLLTERVRGVEPESLELHEDANRRVYVKDIGEHSVLGYERVMELLEVGNGNRQVAETKMNEFSSRSHSIVQITISQLHEAIDRRDVESMVSLVDLAGSERQTKTETTGQQFEEAKRINQSLLMLGRALNSFSDGKSDGFISLRESKLTRLLSECFGGNSKTWMLATVSPAEYNMQETMSTLDYATNAKKIENRAHINKLARNLELKELRELTTQLEARLTAERDKNKQWQDAIATLESEREELRKAASEKASTSSVGVLEDKLRKQTEENETLRREILKMKESREESTADQLTARSTVQTFVARAGVSMMSVFEARKARMTLPLADGRGVPTGAELEVMLIPLVDGEQIESDTPLRKNYKDAVGATVEFVVVVVGATNVPDPSDRVFCKYSFRHDVNGNWYRTPELQNTRNPVWDFERHFILNDLSEDIVDCFANEPVFIFEVFGLKK